MEFAQADMNKAHNNIVSFNEKKFWTTFLHEEEVPYEICRTFFLKMSEFREENNLPMRRRGVQEIVFKYVPFCATTYVS